MKYANATPKDQVVGNSEPPRYAEPQTVISSPA